MAEEENKKHEEKENKAEEKKEEKKEEAKEEKKEKQEEKKHEKEEKEKKFVEFTIPLGKKFRQTPRYKKTPKAIKTIKEFLVRHMKLYDRDLKKIKLDKYLNELMWERGIRNPPSKIKVKVFKDGEIIRAELAEMPERFKFKKERLERREKAAEKEKKKGPEKPEETKEKTEEEKVEEKEKKAAVVEAGQKIEKAIAKQAKHAGKEKPMQPKRQRRMALQK